MMAMLKLLEAMAESSSGAAGEVVDEVQVDLQRVVQNQIHLMSRLLVLISPSP
jgi:hypothetical protein